MRAGPLRLAAALAGVAATIAGPAPAEAAQIGRITLRLFYEESGRLSDQVEEGPSFNSWNMAWGGGSAEEPANDILVSVELVRDDEAAPIPGTLEIIARNGQGRLLARRRFRDMAFGEGRSLWKSLLLRDATCDCLDIIVTLGGETRRLQPSGFYCAE